MDNGVADVVENYGGRDHHVHGGARHAQGADRDGVLDQSLCAGLVEIL